MFRQIRSDEVRIGAKSQEPDMDTLVSCTSVSLSCHVHTSLVVIYVRLQVARNHSNQGGRPGLHAMSIQHNIGHDMPFMLAAPSAPRALDFHSDESRQPP